MSSLSEVVAPSFNPLEINTAERTFGKCGVFEGMVMVGMHEDGGCMKMEDLSPKKVVFMA